MMNRKGGGRKRSWPDIKDTISQCFPGGTDKNHENLVMMAARGDEILTIGVLSNNRRLNFLEPSLSKKEYQPLDPLRSVCTSSSTTLYGGAEVGYRAVRCVNCHLLTSAALLAGDRPQNSACPQSRRVLNIKCR
jgi:hypothetical protein